MNTYTAWYSQTDTYKVWFEADSYEHAQYLLSQVNSGEAGLEELPEFSSKLKGVEIEFATDTLEDLDK